MPTGRRQPNPTRKILAPAILAAAGAFLLLANLGVVPSSRLALPLLGGVVGVLLLGTAARGSVRCVAGLSLLGCSGLFLLSRLGYLPGVQALWPAFLLVVAAAILGARWR